MTLHVAVFLCFAALIAWFKTKADGTQIIVASRWSLFRDENGPPVAILATNNDGGNPRPRSLT